MVVSEGAFGATHFNKLISLPIMMIMVAALAGCASQPLSGLFSPSESSQVASPGRVTAPVSIAAPIGAPTEISSKLTAQIKAAASRQNVTIAGEGVKPNYTVRGYLAASPEANQSKIAYIWDVTDRESKRVHRIAGEELVPARAGSTPWAGVDDATINRIATKTANDLAAWLPKDSAPQPVAARRSGPAPAPADTAASGEVFTYVPAVTGAPGDGQRSLSLAIKKQLFKNGIKITSTPGRAAYTVKATVEASQPQGGKQKVSIRWEVLDPSGRHLGTVSQQNSIDQGALDGKWGGIADAAAGAATDGILKLLPKPKT